MEPVFFDSPAQWRKWLAKNHKKEKEILVGFVKIGIGEKCMTWPESVEEALCYGWIDGVRRRVDARAYTIRFTPRKKGSVWSATNVKLVAKLVKENRMRAAGVAAFEARKAARTGVYAYENGAAALAPAQEARFQANADAWRNFHALPPSYRKGAIWWVVSAKRDATQAARLAQLIADSAAGERVKHLRPRRGA